ncbi:MAG: hypothetical protein Q9182_004483 [Xanthomendoza sp. 2 TL-2023]
MTPSKHNNVDSSISNTAGSHPHVQLMGGALNVESAPDGPERPQVKIIGDTSEQQLDIEAVDEPRTNDKANTSFPGQIQSQPMSSQNMSMNVDESKPEDDIETAEHGKPTESMSEQRIREGRQTVTGYADYLMQLENRVAFLETKFQSPLREEAKKPENPEHRVPAIPQIRRFKLTDFMNKVKDERAFAIEVLIDSQLPQTPTHATEREAPRRIRINSIPVIKILSELVRGSMAMTWTLEPTVFIHPFKPFFLYQNEIRGRLAMLEREWAKHDQGSAAEPLQNDLTTIPASSTINEETKPAAAWENIIAVETAGSSTEVKHNAEEHDLTDSVEALRDWRCLIRFMDEDLFPTIPNFLDSSLKQVLFKDLWYLLRPGQEVFIPRIDVRSDDGVSEGIERPPRDSTQTRRGDGRYQEYWKIIACGGGRVNIHPPEDDYGESSASKQTPNPFEIVAFHLDFTDRFRAIPHTFTVRPFDGRRDITSLPACPSRYLSNAFEERSRLITRGLKFRELTKARHMRYKGMTLACHPCDCLRHGEQTLDSREKIESNVMVDFAEVIHDNYKLAHRLHSAPRRCYNWREVEDRTPVKVWKDHGQHELYKEGDDAIYNEIDDNDIVLNLARAHPLFTQDPERAYTDGSALRSEDLVLLPNRVLAFAFRHRKFVALEVEGLEEVEIYEQGWDDLKLPLGHKDMLKSLVGTHLKDAGFRSAQEYDNNHSHDLVRGKGM